ncbi:MAG: MFS transporter [Candidatus Omnitrophica bacterium]|nr:MFS transporter [Candidatus Omnitrophota bacterium]
MIKLLTKLEHRNFQRLWWAQLISQFGDRITQLALVGLIAERQPGSAMEMAKLMAFTILPVFLIQPFAGVLVDRWDRRTTLFICDIVRGFLILSIPFIFIRWHNLIPVYLIVFTVFSFSRFYVPAKMSILPDIVDKESLLMANSLVSTTGMIAFVLGCALGGFLVDKFGAKMGFVIDAGTFYISAVILFFMALPMKLRINKAQLIRSGRELVGQIRQSVWTEAREGIIYLFRQKEIRFVIDMLFVLLAAAGSVYVVIIVFIQQSFHSITRDLGVLAVALGGGLFLGAVLYGKWGRRFGPYRTIFFCLTLGGICLTVFAGTVYYSPNILSAIMLSFILGVVIGPIFIAANTLAQVVADDQMRGKVFSAMEIVIHFSFLVSMMLSAWISEYVSRFWILLFVGFVVAGVGVVGFFRIRYEEQKQAAPAC